MQSRCYCENVHGVSVHISVRILYVQNRKSFCHCRMQLRRCKSLKPCWSLAYVKKNVSLLQASRRHDQDSWCRIFFDHNASTRLLGEQLVTVALLVLHFSYMRQVLLLVSLFYGKCYVTMFIREYVAFSYRYLGKFLFKMRRNCLESFFFPSKT